MYRPSRHALAIPALTAALLLGACSSSSDENTTDGSTPVDVSAAPEESAPDPAIDPTGDSSVATTEATAPVTAADVAPSGSGDFCSDLKDYQLQSQERVSPVVLGQADEGEYLAWADGVLEELVAEGPSEAKDFLTLQRTTIPTILEAARNGNVGVVDILEDPEYQAAYDSFATWVTGNCSQDVVDIITMGTGGA